MGSVVSAIEHVIRARRRKGPRLHPLILDGQHIVNVASS